MVRSYRAILLIFLLVAATAMQARLGCNAQCTTLFDPATGTQRNECLDLSWVELDLGWPATSCRLVRYCARYTYVNEQGGTTEVTECFDYCSANLCYSV